MRKNIYGFSLLVAAVVGLGTVALPGSAGAAPSICDGIAGNLIANCGFESGDFSGWTQSGNTGFTGPDNGLNASPNSGDWFAALGPVGSDGFLSQTFADTPGQTLRIEFFYGSDGGTPNDFNVSFNLASLLSLTDDPAHGYSDYVFTVIATGLDTLTIGGFRNDPGFLDIDDISVTASVPEPASLGLLGIALAGFGILRRRRNGA